MLIVKMSDYKSQYVDLLKNGMPDEGKPHGFVDNPLALELIEAGYATGNLCPGTHDDPKVKINPPSFKPTAMGRLSLQQWEAELAEKTFIGRAKSIGIPVLTYVLGVVTNVVINVISSWYQS